MAWSPIYNAYMAMMLPILAIAVFLIHDWWKGNKEIGHGKRT